MVIAFIFLIHVFFIIYIVFKKWKKESFGSAFIDLSLMIILFSVGWSISTMVCKIFFDPIGFGKYFDRNTISIFVLSVAEFFFYRFYYKNLFSTGVEKEK